MAAIPLNNELLTSMLFLISPAKRLDETTRPPIISQQEPALLDQAKALIKIAQKLSPPDIERLMKVSGNIALLTAARFSDFKIPFTIENAKPALFLFKGDVYEGIDAYNLPPKALNYLGKNLLILSGLYGLLRAFDLMQPYRLEMGTRLKNTVGNNLYEFWGDSLTLLINKILKEKQTDIIINLASNEYFKAVNPKLITGSIITPIFKERENGHYKTISFHAKRARGLMVKFASEAEITHPEALKNFDREGYYFKEINPKNRDEWLFYRDH